VKRLAKVVGVVSGVIAVVWAMRDRLISITAPREPEPPRFRVVTPPSSPRAGAPPPRSDDLTDIVGIGPVFADRLTIAGILGFADLARAGAARAAEITGVPVTRAEGWISQAEALASS
jgi:predicted flap endonuclease-1-like 5' DNA nuclease